MGGNKGAAGGLLVLEGQVRGGQAAWAPSLPPPPPGSSLLVPGTATLLTAPPPCLPSPIPWPGDRFGQDLWGWPLWRGSGNKSQLI